MTHHDLKTRPENFDGHMTGKHMLSIRKDDRGYRIADTVRFIEWTVDSGYTGRSSPVYQVTGIIHQHPGLKDEYVILLLYGPFYSRRVA